MTSPGSTLVTAYLANEIPDQPAFTIQFVLEPHPDYQYSYSARMLPPYDERIEIMSVSIYKGLENPHNLAIQCDKNYSNAGKMFVLTIDMTLRERATGKVVVLPTLRCEEFHFDEVSVLGLPAPLPPTFLLGALENAP